MTEDKLSLDAGSGALSATPDRAVVNGAESVSALRASVPSADDPAYNLPLPPTWALDTAARNDGFVDWFSVPAAFRTPQNRRIIVEARKIVKIYGHDQLAAECRERATYLKAMEPEGLSTIERQAMETLFKAAQAIEARRAETQSGSVYESAVGSADAPNSPLTNPEKPQ